MPRSSFSAGGYTPCLRDYKEEGSFIRDGPELQNQLHRLLACGKFRSSRITQNSFVLVSGGGEDGSVLWVL